MKLGHKKRKVHGLVKTKAAFVLFLNPTKLLILFNPKSIMLHFCCSFQPIKSKCYVILTMAFLPFSFSSPSMQCKNRIAGNYEGN